jgi:DNA-binding response OmpR family regulator
VTQQKIAIYDSNQLSQKELLNQFALCEDMTPISLDFFDDIKETSCDLIIYNQQNGDELDLAYFKDIEVPVLVLSADEQNDIYFEYYELIKKPCRFAQLTAHIRFYADQHLQYDIAPFTIGSYTCMPSMKELTDRQGQIIKLTEKEMDILCYLYNAEQNVVSREVLLSEVWGYNSNVTTHTLETHMYRLRKKIEKDPTQSEYIITESGGYKLMTR